MERDMASKRAARRVFGALALMGAAGAIAAGGVLAIYGDDRGITAVSAILFSAGVLGLALNPPQQGPPA